MTRSEPDVATIRLSPHAEGIGEAVRLLGDGRLVAIPTETVYGLAADASDPAAVAGIFAAKERPRFNPLIAHLPDEASARREGVLDDNAARLAKAFWPGPLTLVVPAAPDCSVCDLARAGLPSLALRVPNHPVAHALLARFGRPLAAPSANRSGRVSPTRVAHVLDDLDGRIAAVLDGDASPIGVESTIVACLGGRARLLRPGAVSRADLCDVLGSAPDNADEDGTRPVAPGLLASHYAPRAQVRYPAETVLPGEAALLFGDVRPAGLEGAARILNLSERGDVAEAAARLFQALRRLDEPGIATIAVTVIPESGLGEAINDRLRRAAAPR